MHSQKRLVWSLALAQDHFLLVHVKKTLPTPALKFQEYPYFSSFAFFFKSQKANDLSEVHSWCALTFDLAYSGYPRRLH